MQLCKQPTPDGEVQRVHKREIISASKEDLTSLLRGPPGPPGPQGSMGMQGPAVSILHR